MASDTTTAPDHRKRPRRRGEALTAAIFQATLDELAEGGYAALTMEGVAERARASKASVYRRWPSRIELVMDAVTHTLPDMTSPRDTGSLRGDLLAVLRQMTGLLAGPTGEALRGVLSDMLSDRERTAQLRRRSRGTGRSVIEAVARRAVERGEIDASAITPRRLDVGLAMLRNYFLFDGEPIADEVVVAIVDEILVPLFAGGHGSKDL